MASILAPAPKRSVNTANPAAELLYDSTRLKTALTVGVPLGGRKVIPSPPLSATIVFDTAILLDVVGAILMPLPARLRTMQFSMVKEFPVFNTMPVLFPT